MIPLHRPWFDRREEDAVLRVLRSGEVAGNGRECRVLERRLSERLGAPHVLAVASASAALEIAAHLMGLRGKEVILPSFTFPSVGNAIVRAGGRPVFCEIREPDLNLDPEDAAGRVRRNTGAIVLTHYAGHPVDPGGIGVPILEDAAHALGSSLNGRPCGRIGTFGCLSFHGTKTVVAGEGGALICPDEGRAEAASIFREKGTNRDAHVSGKVSSYCWVGLGGSFVLPELSAALAVVQLGKLDEILAARRRVAAAYDDRLAELERRERLRIVRRLEGTTSHHLYAVLVDPRRRDSVIRSLRAEGIGAASHFFPLHLSPFGREVAGAQSLPRTERIAASLIRLPIHPGLTEVEIDRVATALERALS